MIRYFCVLCALCVSAILLSGCATGPGLQTVQGTNAMQEHARAARGPGETTVEITIQQPGWVMAGKAAFSSGHGADTAAQATAAEALAKSQTNAKISNAASDAIQGTAQAFSLAIAGAAGGVPGLGIVGGAQTAGGLFKLLHGETDLIKTHYYFQGPTPGVMIVGLGFDANENPWIRQMALSKQAAACDWQAALITLFGGLRMGGGVSAAAEVGKDVNGRW